MKQRFAMKASPSSRFMRALQVGGLLGLAVFLWGGSLLPIQRLGLVCECIILVSDPQLARLSEMSGQSRLASSTIQWLVCEPTSAGSVSGRATSLEGEVAVRKVRIRLGLCRRTTVNELETELDNLTASSVPTEKISASAQRAISQARWRLQVAEHALTRFRLDCCRDGIALPEGREVSPFRLASQSSVSSSSNDKRMFDSLAKEVEVARQALTAADSSLLNQDGKSRALITVAGAPRFGLRGGALDRFRASVVLLLAMGGFCTVSMGWKRRPSRKRTGFAIATHEDYMTLLDGLRIAYLGAFAMETPHVRADQAVDAEDRASVVGKSRVRSLRRLSMLSRWSNRILMLWLACFALRYLVDPLWRELLFQAPLAAFSCVLFGI